MTFLVQFARHVKVTAEDSPYFSIQASKNAGGKVAPGMEVTYTITFSPDSSKVRTWISVLLYVRMYMYMIDISSN